MHNVRTPSYFGGVFPGDSLRPISLYSYPKNPCRAIPSALLLYSLLDRPLDVFLAPRGITYWATLTHFTLGVDRMALLVYLARQMVALFHAILDEFGLFPPRVEAPAPGCYEFTSGWFDEEADMLPLFSPPIRFSRLLLFLRFFARIVMLGPWGP